MHHEVELAFLAAPITIRFFPVGLFWTKKCSDILFPLEKVYLEKMDCFLMPYYKAVLGNRRCWADQSDILNGYLLAFDSESSE